MYQVSVFTKTRTPETHLIDVQIDAPSRRSAKIALKQRFGRDIVCTFVDPDPSPDPPQTSQLTSLPRVI